MALTGIPGAHPRGEAPQVEPLRIPPIVQIHPAPRRNLGSHGDVDDVGSIADRYRPAGPLRKEHVIDGMHALTGEGAARTEQVAQQELFPAIIHHPGQRPQHAPGARQARGDRAEANLDELEVHQLGASAIGQRIAVSRAIGGKDVHAKALSRASGGQDHRPGRHPDDVAVLLRYQCRADHTPVLGSAQQLGDEMARDDAHRQLAQPAHQRLFDVIRRMRPRVAGPRVLRAIRVELVRRAIRPPRPGHPEAIKIVKGLGAAARQNHRQVGVRHAPTDAIDVISVRPPRRLTPGRRRRQSGVKGHAIRAGGSGNPAPAQCALGDQDHPLARSRLCGSDGGAQSRASAANDQHVAVQAHASLPSSRPPRTRRR